MIQMKQNNKRFLFFLILAGSLLMLFQPTTASEVESDSVEQLESAGFDYTSAPLSPETVSDYNAWNPLTEFSRSELSKSGELWLRIQLDEPVSETRGLMLTAFLERFDIYSHDGLIYSWPEEPGFAYCKSHMVFPETTGVFFEIYIRIFYSDASGIGEIFSVMTGPKQDLIVAVSDQNESIIKNSIVEICQGFILLVTGIGCLVIFFLRIREGELPFFGFGLFTLTSGITYLSGLHPLCFINVSPPTYHYLKTFSFLLVPVGLFIFAESIFGKGRHNIIRRLWQFHLAFGLIASLLARFHIDATGLIFPVLILTCTLCAVAAIKSGSVSIPDFRIKLSFALFLAFFIILTIVQLLNDLRLIQWSYDLFGWGLLLFSFALGYTLIQHYKNTYNQMLNVSLELEKSKTTMLELQKEKLSSQLEALKNQLDPHFLFNNLSTLSLIIEENQSAAVRFVNELSVIYRYVLQTKVHTLVPLADEISFIDSYYFLMSKRFGNNLEMIINIPEDKKDYLIAPFSLQLLVENAVKHNIISVKKPLRIEISLEDGGFLLVKNNLQEKKNDRQSTGIGLENIEKRYKILTDKTVSVIKTDTEFSVKIPILTHSEINHEDSDH